MERDLIDAYSQLEGNCSAANSTYAWDLQPLLLTGATVSGDSGARSGCCLGDEAYSKCPIGCGCDACRSALCPEQLSIERRALETGAGSLRYCQPYAGVGVDPMTAASAAEYIETAPAKIKKVRESVKEARETIKESLATARGIIQDIGQLHVDLYNDIVTALNTVGQWLGTSDPPYKAWRPGIDALGKVAAKRPNLRELLFVRSIEPASEGDFRKSVAVARASYLAAKQFVDLAYTRMVLKAAMRPVSNARRDRNNMILDQSIKGQIDRIFWAYGDTPRFLSPAEYNSVLKSFVALRKQKLPRNEEKRALVEDERDQADIVIQNIDRVDASDLIQLVKAFAALKSWLDCPTCQ